MYLLLLPCIECKAVIVFVEELTKSKWKSMHKISWLTAERIVFIKKWAIPGLFFVNFRLFIQTLQFLQQINVKKCPSNTG